MLVSTDPHRWEHLDSYVVIILGTVLSIDLRGIRYINRYIYVILRTFLGLALTSLFLGRQQRYSVSHQPVSQQPGVTKVDKPIGFVGSLSKYCVTNESNVGAHTHTHTHNLVL